MFRVVVFFVRRQAQGDKTLVFCDSIFALKTYARALGRSYICGETKQQDRARLFESFRQGVPQFETLFVSRVGDVASAQPCLFAR